MLTSLVNCGFRIAYRFAWPIVRRFRQFSKNDDGANVAVWANGRLLVVRHSYKPGLSIPGGGINRGEDPHVGGARELWEEVGIRVEPAALNLIRTKQFTRGMNYFYEIAFDTQPQIKIDQREIIYAEFLSPEEIMLSGCDKYFTAYLTSREIALEPVVFESAA